MFLSRDRFRNKVKIVKEEKLLGTAGTIKSLSKNLLDCPTLVIHADNFCGMDLVDFVDLHQEKRPKVCKFSMMTFDTQTPQSCGVLKLDEKSIVREFYEKPQKPISNCANGAVYLLEPSIVEWLAQREISDFSTEVIPSFMGKIFAINNSKFHIDIGSFEGLKKAQCLPPKKLFWETKDEWLCNFASNPIHNSIKALKASKNE